jgi:hypothetical protein
MYRSSLESLSFKIFLYPSDFLSEGLGKNRKTYKTKELKMFERVGHEHPLIQKDRA